MSTVLISALLACAPLQAQESRVIGDAHFSQKVQEVLIQSTRQSAESRDRFRRNIMPAAAGFYTPGQTPDQPLFSADVQKSVVKLNSWFTSCTGTYISRSGYILTASHCVKSYMQRAQVRSVSQLTLTEHGSDANPYDAVRTNMRAEAYPTFLVVAGRGYLKPRASSPDVSDLARQPNLIEQIRHIAPGDWAILKTQTDHPSPCVPAQPTAPAAGSRLWDMGFPGPAFRSDDNAPSSPGGVLVETYGRKAADLRTSAWLATLNSVSQTVFYEIYQPGIAAGELILSDNDAYHGKSGGPIFDQTGRLIGLHTASGNTADKFRTDSSLGVSVQKVFADLRSAGIDPAKYFSCPSVTGDTPDTVRLQRL